ncbi:hypothetical protein PoMZ_01736 [Pyricularia oryzae]|uniref:Uncharacterized protein n=1 Tax=Pyricularia oryzae TaxID=318829 RepID=A0A4P7N332_PYROR|nr:hypothetical protein PoMZ_01736 [Pyricularia oryzae]
METRHCFKDSKAAVLSQLWQLPAASLDPNDNFTASNGKHRLCWRLFRRARANLPAQRHDDLSWVLATLRKTTCVGAHRLPHQADPVAYFACAANHDNVGLGRRQNPSSRWLL